MSMFLEDTDCLFLFMSRQCYLPVREVRTLQKSFGMRVLVITDSEHDAVEISIYSTCKRISQKILRNVAKFAMMVADGDYKNLNFTVKRENMEEINLQGPLGRTDTRIINSYPSKVKLVYLRGKSQRSKVKSQKSKSYCSASIKFQ